MKTNGIIFLKDWKLLITSLSAENQLVFWDLFTNYEHGEDQICDNPFVFPIWTFIKAQMDNMKDKYNEKVVHRNQQNGAKGGRPRKETQEVDNKPENPMGLNETQKSHNKKNNENEKSNENDILLEKESKDVVEEVGDEQGKISDLKNLLKTKKQIQMDRLKMQHKLSDEQLNIKIDEFVEKKVSWEDDKWRNESDMAKNFEFWLNKNPMPVNNFKSWTKQQFWDEIKGITGTVKLETKKEFFEHYAMMAQNGKMRFQGLDAWETKAMLKKWLNNKKNYETRT